jgi:hypothetical protein
MGKIVPPEFLNQEFGMRHKSVAGALAMSRREIEINRV